jgi:hypothetical protein
MVFGMGGGGGFSGQLVDLYHRKVWKNEAILITDGEAMREVVSRYFKDRVQAVWFLSSVAELET